MSSVFLTLAFQAVSCSTVGRLSAEKAMDLMEVSPQLTVVSVLSVSRFWCPKLILSHIEKKITRPGWHGGSVLLTCTHLLRGQHSKVIFVLEFSSLLECDGSCQYLI